MLASTSPCHTHHLGTITHSQCQRALDVFHLGKLRDYYIPEKGLSGQVVKLITSDSAYYLRGKPRFPGQFQREKYFANELHNKTNVPVPHPYMLSTDATILGWEFCMIPAMPGFHVFHHDRAKQPFRLTNSDWLQIARAQGRILREAQKVTHTHCGNFDPINKTIKPHTPDWLTHFKKRPLAQLQRLSKHNPTTTTEDIRWAERMMDEAGQFIHPFTPCVYFQDFKYDNMLFNYANRKWCITALFDFAYTSFGHPEADLARLYSYYSMRAPLLATQFIEAFLDETTDKRLFAKRFPLFVLHDRVHVWNCLVTRGYSTSNQTFKEWASGFLSNIDLLQSTQHVTPYETAP